VSGDCELKYVVCSGSDATFRDEEIVC
jgi:hypothetical protein